MMNSSSDSSVCFKVASEDWELKQVHRLNLGFAPFGPLVGSGAALYQPMYLTLEAFRGHAKAFGAHR